MRYSVDQDDPGYANWKAIGTARCWIDGVERGNVITADEEKRVAVLAVLDDHGMPKLNAARTEVLTETVYGAVRVEPKT